MFSLRLPLPFAPTMNEYAAKKQRKWALKKLNKEVDELIEAVKPAWPLWDMGVERRTEPKMVDGRLSLTKRGKVRVRTIVEGGWRRHVVVTRYSSRQPDELSVDVVGGKLVVDRLVLAGVLRDDSPRWCVREARWEQAPPGRGSLRVDVYEWW
ncbi:MAG: hypothetical protein GVY18_07685 [Bacteroidetes bacterium]|nr:hypothetical protein [Bacteroidota bacterium]